MRSASCAATAAPLRSVTSSGSMAACSPAINKQSDRRAMASGGIIVVARHSTHAAACSWQNRSGRRYGETIAYVGEAISICAGSLHKAASALCCAKPPLSLFIYLSRFYKAGMTTVADLKSGFIVLSWRRHYHLANHAYLMSSDAVA